MNLSATRLVRGCAVALGLGLLAGLATAQAVTLDAGLRERIDQFVETERQASGIPGIALAIVQGGQTVHVRGFGDDGRSRPVSADTPFPIGSLTKSFTALLVRQAITAGQLEADAPVQRYLPWFRVADADAAARITLRHLLNQTSGFSRADGMAPLVSESQESIEQLARGLATVSLNRPVGERFEYSNLNFVLLGAVLQAVTGKPWQELIQTQVFKPLAMSHCHTDPHAAEHAARQAGMTAVHRMWFGQPVQQPLAWLPGFAPTGSLVSSAADMARYLQMLLAGGQAPSGTVLSSEAVAQLLAPAAPPARSMLLSTPFEFRYGEGWFVGPFGAARDARWHLGNLPSFAAWMVLLPQTDQAVVLLINANSELPFNEVNAVFSRLPIGVVNLLRGAPPPQGPSLQQAYRPFNAASAIGLVLLGGLSAWAARARRLGWAACLLIVANVLAFGLQSLGLGVKTLPAFAPDLAMVVVASLLLLCLPALMHMAAWLRRSLLASRRHGPVP
jgi:CubicO group peptidase (beta-lactamase class C family)